MNSPVHTRLSTTVSTIVSVAPNNDAWREGSRVVRPTDLRLALGPMTAPFAIRLFVPASYPWPQSTEGRQTILMPILVSGEQGGTCRHTQRRGRGKPAASSTSRTKSACRDIPSFL